MSTASVLGRRNIEYINGMKVELALDLPFVDHAAKVLEEPNL